MKEKKKYEKPRILEITKIEAIAGRCERANFGKADPGSCWPLLS